MRDSPTSASFLSFDYLTYVGSALVGFPPASLLLSVGVESTLLPFSDGAVGPIFWTGTVALVRLRALGGPRKTFNL